MNRAPRRLILLRHAEKTGAPGDPDLSVEGVRRAARLVEAIPEAFGSVDFIVAAISRPTSRRPRQTVEPLAAALGLSVQEWDDDDAAGLAKALLGDKTHAGRQGVICWRHNALQALAQALGAKEAQPWQKPVYDRYWVLEFQPDGVTFQELAQPF